MQGCRVPPPRSSSKSLDSGQWTKNWTLASGQKIGHWTVDSEQKIEQWTVRKKSDTGK